MPSILLVDDDPDVLDSIERVLVNYGFSVSTAASANGALQHLAFHCPDLIITDIFMVGGDGFEFLRAVRRRGIEIPVIAISGAAVTAAQVDKFDIADKLGAAATVSKPFRPAHLIEVIYKVLGTPNPETGNDRGDPDGR